MSGTTWGKPPQTSVLHLPTIRQKTGLSLEQIAESTKISIYFLRAIEEEDFSRLPGGIFDRSYIRQYADAIGIDAAEVLEEYQRRTSCALQSPTPQQASPGCWGRWRLSLRRWISSGPLAGLAAIGRKQLPGPVR